MNLYTNSMLFHNVIFSRDWDVRMFYYEVSIVKSRDEFYADFNHAIEIAILRNFREEKPMVKASERTLERIDSIIKLFVTSSL